jgi:hypothetical protein
MTLSGDWNSVTRATGGNYGFIIYFRKGNLDAVRNSQFSRNKTEIKNLIAIQGFYFIFF